MGNVSLSGTYLEFVLRGRGTCGIRCDHPVLAGMNRRHEVERVGRRRFLLLLLLLLRCQRRLRPARIQGNCAGVSVGSPIREALHPRVVLRAWMIRREHHSARIHYSRRRLCPRGLVARVATQDVLIPPGVDDEACRFIKNKDSCWGLGTFELQSSIEVVLCCEERCKDVETRS